MLIISKYCYETRLINILHVEEDYEDAVHHCIDHILDHNGSRESCGG